MENIHVLEPVFHNSAGSFHSVKGQWHNTAIASRLPDREYGVIGGWALGLLERLHLFSVPRIISAECFIVAEDATVGEGR